MTNEIMHGAFDLKVENTRQNLKRENLRDHMTDIELILTMLAEAITTKRTATDHKDGPPERRQGRRRGGREDAHGYRHQTGKPVISNENSNN